MLVLSCVLGWVVAKISLKLKHKSFVTVAISLLGIAAYYFFYFKAQTVLGEVVANALLYGEKIKKAANLLYLVGRVGEGDGADKIQRAQGKRKRHVSGTAWKRDGAVYRKSQLHAELRTRFRLSCGNGNFSVGKSGLDTAGARCFHGGRRPAYSCRGRLYLPCLLDE